ncbi:DUF389 domain-containing protein [Streptomyces wuyuanensis]|uniref:DUF389 domain-containing protein n=1 Tax=Streptomyces wuyuanensis TaxID=1196353 RepID=UPI0037AA8DFC
MALARKDVAAVLPGVAIAISLVPTLAVGGVCAGQTAWWRALGPGALPFQPPRPRLRGHGRLRHPSDTPAPPCNTPGEPPAAPTS